MFSTHQAAQQHASALYRWVGRGWVGGAGLPGPWGACASLTSRTRPSCSGWRPPCYSHPAPTCTGGAATCWPATPTCVQPSRAQAANACPLGGDAHIHRQTCSSNARTTHAKRPRAGWPSSQGCSPQRGLTRARGARPPQHARSTAAGAAAAAAAPPSPPCVRAPHDLCKPGHRHLQDVRGPGAQQGRPGGGAAAPRRVGAGLPAGGRACLPARACACA